MEAKNETKPVMKEVVLNAPVVKDWKALEPIIWIWPRRILWRDGIPSSENRLRSLWNKFELVGSFLRGADLNASRC